MLCYTHTVYYAHAMLYSYCVLVILCYSHTILCYIHILILRYTYTILCYTHYMLYSYYTIQILYMLVNVTTISSRNAAQFLVARTLVVVCHYTLPFWLQVLLLLLSDLDSPDDYVTLEVCLQELLGKTINFKQVKNASHSSHRSFYLVT